MEILYEYRIFDSACKEKYPFGIQDIQVKIYLKI